MTEKDTKQKVLEAANELFAKHGFVGASIRDIATKADVNLAAINYHFKNKENLYWEVFDYNYELLNTGVRRIGARTETTVDLTREVFRFFMSDKDALMNTFKVFLSDNVSMPVERIESDVDKDFGPPGGEAFAEKIRHDLGEEVSAAGQEWVTKMIFSLLVHFGVVLNTTVMQLKCKTTTGMNPEDFERALLMSVEAHLNYLRENPKKFS